MQYDSSVLTEADPYRLGPRERVILLTTMMRIRAFEEKLSDLMVERDEADRACRLNPQAVPYPEEKRIRTPCHLYIGQEAVAAGVCAVLRRDDWIWSTHRAHGHYLAKGGDLQAGLAEILCRATGCSKGRGGSMHMCAPEVGMLGSSSIVAGAVPLGVGAAMAEMIRGSTRVSVIFHGDAVPEEGVFHESLNWAVLKSLPVVFCCENNQYSSHLHIRYRRRSPDLSLLVKGYDLPVEDVDGNDVRAVMEAAHRAVRRAREGGGPTFLHLHTYRLRGHVGPYDNVEVGLRSQAEIDEWIRKCPIDRERTRLIQEGLLSVEQFKELQVLVRQEVEEAAAKAIEAPRPPPNEVERYVFFEQG